MDKILHLTLNKKWFDMILSGEKKEEYREIKPYWITRLVKYFQNYSALINYPYLYDRGKGKYHIEFKSFTHIKFVNGYGKDKPTMILRLDSIVLSKGVEKWGGDPNKYYITIKLGEIIDTKNI